MKILGLDINRDSNGKIKLGSYQATDEEQKIIEDCIRAQTNKGIAGLVIGGTAGFFLARGIKADTTNTSKAVKFGFPLGLTRFITFTSLLVGGGLFGIYYGADYYLDQIEKLDTELGRQARKITGGWRNSMIERDIHQVQNNQNNPRK